MIAVSDSSDDNLVRPTGRIPGQCLGLRGPDSLGINFLQGKKMSILGKTEMVRLAGQNVKIIAVTMIE